MRVFVAGASGALGRPLLQAAGRRRPRGDGNDAQRGEGRGDARGGRERGDLRRLRRRGPARSTWRAPVPRSSSTRSPTSPRGSTRGTITWHPTNRIRTEGTRNLIAAAQAAGARRLIAESVAFLYAPEGDWVKDEDARIDTEAPGHFGTAMRGARRPRGPGPLGRRDRRHGAPLRLVLRAGNPFRP